MFYTGIYYITYIFSPKTYLLTHILLSKISTKPLLCRNKTSVVLSIGLLALFATTSITLLLIIFVGIKLKKIKFNVPCRNKSSSKGNTWILCTFYNVNMRNHNVSIHYLSITHTDILTNGVFERYGSKQK